MERSSKRGKIPQRDWPLIIKRYEGGETLASIARTYDCSPPAISYILSRHRARDGSMENPTRSPGPVLAQEAASTVTAAEAEVKAEASGTASENFGAPTTDPIDASACSQQEEPNSAANAAPGPPAGPILAASAKNGPAKESDDVPRAAISGDGRSPSEVPVQNGEARRTLHLSPAQDGDHRHAMRPGAEQPALLAQADGQRVNFPVSTHSGQSFPGTGQPQKTKGGAASVDRALRERVEDDISAFLAAFDAALAQDSLESRAGLRDATDRLLRAGARTRIELERLEARIPLSTREDRPHPAPPWRPR